MPRLTNNEAAGMGWTHVYTVDYTDFTEASTTQTFSMTVPAGVVVCNCGFYLETAFDGGATSTMVLIVGATDDDGFLASTVVHADGTEVIYSANTGIQLIGDENTGAKRSVVFTAADTLDMKFTATGANVTALTTGRIHIYFDIKNLVPGNAGLV